MKILALREKFEHMSVYSGYDALYHHLPPQITVDSVFCNYKKMYPQGIGRLLATTAKFASPSGFYNAQSVEAELKLSLKSFKKNYNIIHYSYGESYLGLGGLLKKFTKSATIVTNHQPVSWWQENKDLYKKYNHVDKVITLSEYDRDYFNNVIRDKAICIPHGVDTFFYKPLQVKKDRNAPFKVIFSGRYLRDMVTLAAVVKKLSTSALRIQFDIVYINKTNIKEPYLIELLAYPNVNWHADISEQQFLNLYQNADCCLIPLVDCTANNAILEAMACGLPIVSTNLPAIKTYLDESVSILGRKGNTQDLCDAILMLHQNIELRNTMSLNARERAVTSFEWNKIAAQTTQLFKSLQ